MKRIFYTEIAYVLGLVVLALGTACMEAASFGVSMVVAPAYLIYLKVSEFLPFFTFGMAEYSLQALLLIFMMLVLKRMRGYYFFSIITAILYALLLDGSMWVVAHFVSEILAFRIGIYIVGLGLCALGVSLLFHTYLAPEVYELFVKEVTYQFKWNIHKVKTSYDCISCFISIILSFVFFGIGDFRGVHIGTIVCALINGWLISRWTYVFERFFIFKDRLDFRYLFDNNFKA